jgi:hypothetical protein
MRQPVAEKRVEQVCASPFGCITVPFLLIAIIPLAWVSGANWMNGELARSRRAAGEPRRAVRRPDSQLVHRWSRARSLRRGHRATLGCHPAHTGARRLRLQSLARPYLYLLTPDTSLPAITQLPGVRNDRQQVTVDTACTRRKNVRLGVRYEYDRFLVRDFALDGSTLNGIVFPSTLPLGYYDGPYTANAITVRMTYLW